MNQIYWVVVSMTLLIANLDQDVGDGTVGVTVQGDQGNHLSDIGRRYRCCSLL